MFWIVLFGGMIIVSAFLSLLSDKYSCLYHSEVVDVIKGVFMAFGCLGLAIALFMIPIHRHLTHAKIQEHEAVRYTVNMTREQDDITQWERVRLAEDIVEANKKLAYAKYYASHPWFKLYYPSEVLDVDFVE